MTGGMDSTIPPVDELHFSGGSNHMTRNALNEILRLRQQRAKLHNKEWDLRSSIGSLSSPWLDGAPGASNDVNRKVERRASELADLALSIEAKDLEILRAEKAIQQFISTVADSQLRLILRYRFVCGLSWEGVARAMGTYETVGRVKMTYLRGMKEYEQDPT